ncbi:MAG: HEPN domain-containing protein [Candidatus Omnitrophica bacterium]|nr:HEPN domain-containing protein [Candidatus Omnitrophota bacterium]
MNEKAVREIKAYMARCDESIKAASELLVNSHFDFAASRAYYAVFYASSALLLNEGLEFKKHSGVIAAVHQKFIKTNKINQQYGKDLNWLFELRSVGDYGLIVHVGKDEAEEAIKIAKSYVAVVKKIITHNGS